MVIRNDGPERPAPQSQEHAKSGNITIGAAAGVSATLDAGTGHGRISNALRNDGGAELRIRTTSNGDITARSL
ncbi:hypothetical protein ACIG5E_15630 [Kitasatospora sp. NPDC053057]|uniref:hypothetical protein n=1 Tax=Kitasatospora sp. NPDC053057 TaxID=3364062 RepID=UPI0037C50D99